MRDDGTYMPFDIEFHYDVGYEGDSAVVLGWIDRFLNTIAGAVSELDRAADVVALSNYPRSERHVLRIASSLRRMSHRSSPASRADGAPGAWCFAATP
jgi:hypothetical protein